MNYKIRKLDTKDLKLANELFLQFQDDDGVEKPTSASEEYIAKLLATDDFHVVVAIENGKVIGGLTAYELSGYKDEEAEMFLYELGVEEAFRRKGIATALIDYLKETCLEKEIEEMFVDALANNLPAVKLYENTGGKAAKVVEFTYELD